MADTSTSLKGLREQMVAAAQAVADERRNQSGNSPVPSSGNIKATTKPVIDGSTLRTDERQRLARERREEREKQNAAKESQMIEKEKKAKLQYEKQMEERQRKMEEQKMKEEQRRAAVEEKRKLKTEEERERSEAVLRRTLERSQRLEQRQKRWSWGGAVPSDTDSQTGSSRLSPSNPVDLFDNIPCTAGPQTSDEIGSSATKRSTSSSNLKQAEIVINKRLSSSSATLLNAPDKGVKTRSSSLSRLSNKVPLQSQQPPTKGSQVELKGGVPSKRSSSLNRLTNQSNSPQQLEKVKLEEKSARRSQTSPLESNIISRLLAPTQASLARSKSAAALPADGKDSPDSHLCPRSASANSMTTQAHTPKGPMRSRSIDRQTSASVASASSAEFSSPESTQKPELGKQSPSLVQKRPPSPSNVTNRRRSPSPANVAKRPPSPSTVKPIAQRTRPPSPSSLKQRPSSASLKQPPITRPLLTPTVTNVTKKKSDVESKPKDKHEGLIQESVLSPTSEKDMPVVASKSKEETSSKAFSGTITAEEAAKTLAEKRRLAREQRERDEQENIRRAEEERIQKEESDKRAAEEKVKREEELLKLEKKKQMEEEEELKIIEEERIRKELEDQERLVELQQQKEEAEAKALEEAEKQKLEREKIMLQNMQERLERKKRIEEIMKRTRKMDQTDGKNENKSDDQEAEEIEDEEEFLRCQYANQEELTLQEESKSEEQLIFLNGKELNYDKENEENPANEILLQSSSSTTNENIQSSDVLLGNQGERIDVVQNINGKPSSWTFEEYIDLGVHSKSTILAPDSITINSCNQNLIDTAFIPGIPKLAFEEDGAVSLLTKSIDAASDI
ncbi:MAP7 domain-containing protein 3 isoform X2 [Pleurodeles waltl]|uniref:MAP7 domain-containing protein 3 isoform X2 n=1 Tax=Pleurodeles waltl TaxID=8319 RepID=UPI003709A8C0